MSFAELISSYGYPAMLVGTFIEGETVLILGCVAAQQGYLQWPWVVFTAFLGVLGSDQFYFHLGRIKGPGMIAKRAHWQPRAQRVFQLMHRHQIPLMLGFRFLYGVRIITPVLMGASGISPLRFLICNLIGASTWALLFGSLGYLFGEAMQAVVKDLYRYQLWLFGGLALSGLGIWLLRRWWQRRSSD